MAAALPSAARHRSCSGPTVTIKSSGLRIREYSRSITLRPLHRDPVEQLYRELEAKIREYRPKDDLAVVEKAFRFAARCHEGQTRDSGEPYMVHPMMVAHILADMRMDLIAIQTGLLHDVVEDTSVTVEQVRKEFGDEVARCVDGLTKLSKLDIFGAEERQAESFRKMLLAMVEDIRVIMVKLADRIHNMRTLGYVSPERRERIARETIEIYAPIAHRLGMGKIRGELEDLAFQHLEPDAYTEILAAIESKRHSNEEFLDRDPPDGRSGAAPRRHSGAHRRPPQASLLRLPETAPAEDHGRPGLRPDGAAHHHRLGEELLRGARRDPQPLAADSRAASRTSSRSRGPISTSRCTPPSSVRTGRRSKCRSGPRRCTASPKKASRRTGNIRKAAKGPAADDQRMAWLRHLVEWQRDVQDPGEFMSTLKVDLYPEEVYTFTPRGKVIVLPRDATPIDFAYAIHSDVGTTCVGAKVNGRIVPLRSSLRNGDIVEIMTQPGHEPSKDWLAFVKTSRARNKIKHVINASERVKAIDIGQKYLEKEARRLGVSLGKVSKADLEACASDYGYSKMEDLYAALGYGKFSARQVLDKVAPGRREGRAGAGPAARRPVHHAGQAERRRRRHQSPRHRRPAGVPGQVLQSDPRRGDRRLRDARQRRRGSLQDVPQCAEPDVRRRAQDRGRVGARGRGRLPGARSSSTPTTAPAC